jgi:RNA polymerase sigma factor (sigma-70 family)
MTNERADDRALLERTRQGDPAAFGQFYRRHHAMVLAFVRGRVPTADAAADLMSEVFATALLAVHRGQTAEVDRPVAWLLTLARNKLVDSLRRGKVDAAARRELGIPPATLDDDDIARIEELASSDGRLLALAHGLPSDQWEALNARVLDERTYPEIAQSLGCSELVARKRVSRALKTLRAALLQEAP